VINIFDGKLFFYEKTQAAVGRRGRRRRRKTAKSSSNT